MNPALSGKATMNLEVGCLVGSVDARDYTLADALQKLSRQGNEYLEYALLEYDKPEGEYIRGKVVKLIAIGSTKDRSIRNKQRVLLEKATLEKEEEREEKIEKFILKNIKIEDNKQVIDTGNNNEKIFVERHEDAKTQQAQVFLISVGEDGKETQRESYLEVEAGEHFRRYKLQRLSSSVKDTCDVSKNKSAVFIPLAFRDLEQEVVLKLEASDFQDSCDEDAKILKGEIVLMNNQNETLGKLKVLGDRVIVWDTQNEKGLEGQLIINESGKVVLKGKSKEFNLFLGAGFKKFEMDAVNWSPVKDQNPGSLCAANAGVSLVEYFERVAEGRHFDASRLFLHQVASKLSRSQPTGGTSIKAVVEAMAQFGVPPEEFWNYDIGRLEEEPPAFCYAQARNYRATSYLRLDRSGMCKDALIAQIKVFVYSGLPVIFGFLIHDSINQSFGFKKNARKGNIPFPTFGEIQRRGHAAIIVGYDDEYKITNINPTSQQDRKGRKIDNDQQIISPGQPFLSDDSAKSKLISRGAFKIRNSWGEDWGEDGYGWLPYAYIYQNYAFDFWSIMKFEWLNTQDFGLLVQNGDLVMCKPGQQSQNNHC